MWDQFVELVRLAIFAAAHACGGSLGGGVLLVSFGVRVMLLPLTLRVARRNREQQRRLAILKPELARLQQTYANDPALLFRETQAAYRAHGVRLLAPSSLVTIAIQMPILGALFAAVRTGFGSKMRFLWVADLARPDAVLAVTAAALTAVVSLGAMPSPSATSGSAPSAAILASVIAASTLLFVWSSSATVALSVGGGALVSALQTWLLSRDAKRTHA